MQTIIVNTIPRQTAVFRILKLHADYACQNSGRCCHNAWRITIPEGRLAALRETLGAAGMTAEEFDRQIRSYPDSDNPLIAGEFLRNERGGCSFVGGEPGCSTCTLQPQVGHSALPEICQAFPRLTVRTPAGIYLTLSYTCPTAAKLLLCEGGLGEVAPGLVFQFGPSLVGVAIGDDKRAPTWAPGISPEWAAFDYFWRWGVEFAARGDLTPGQALFTLGLVVGAIEQNAKHLVRLEPLTQLLEKVMGQPASDFLPICQANAPCTELGLIYFETLLRQIPAVPTPLQVLWDPARKAIRERAGTIREFDARVRPCLPELEPIERNFVATRLYANPLAYRSTRLRTGYFANVLSLVALRFSMLALALAAGKQADAAIALEAAGVADDLLLHMEAMQTRFVQTLDTAVDTDLANLRRPALF